MLKLQHLSKSFKETVAVNDINLEVAKGEIFVLFGPTGAGKTTTLRLTAGLEKPDAGRVLIEEADVTAYQPWRRDIALMFEGLNLFPIYTVYDNIAFALRSDIYREPEAEIQKRIEKVAHDLHITHLLKRKPATLSGGETQRVALARALVRHPKFYLLDEPLSNLDLKLREELRVELKELHQHYEATIIFATHDYVSVVALADRIGVIYEGRLHQIGTQDELFQHPQTAIVATLMGAPGMNLISVKRDGKRLVSSHDPQLAFAIRERELIGAEQISGEFLFGIWPEHLEVSLQPRQGFSKGRISGQEFRGMDRVISIGMGEESLKKVVEPSFPGRYGDDCWFAYDRERSYLFAKQSGRRVQVNLENT